ncbi:MAG: selenide, water dikinase SelD, partial [Desulfobacterales bacterium]|nr:selenide, water dikinase SelD [Desulfobacterales bacterium]
FGQIAAANALSDVYAMGGVPKTAMNLVAFPIKQMDIDILRQIIQGGVDKIREADAVLVGGHSIEDSELKYGLSVTGFVHPARILVKKNLRSGDRLILTKPLGTGIINTAIKAAMAPAALIDQVTRLMATLNRAAAETMAAFPVHACTDVTGFGLLGHLAEMVAGSGCSVRIESGKVPILPETAGFAGMGLVPGGAFKNKSFRQAMVTFADGVDAVMQDMLFDPQTSGGLLISIESGKAEALTEALTRRGTPAAAVIGEVLEDPIEKIYVS